MTVRASKGIQPSNSTDTFFRAWTKFIFDAMIAGGWVQTADSGQINFATVLMPTGNNQARGYVVLRANDALQATVPFFVRLDFGSAGAINNMGLWITIGGGSSGAGVITPVYFSSPTGSAPPLAVGSSSTTLVPPYSFISAGTNRVHCALGFNFVSANTGLFFSLERTVSGSGQPGGTGFVLFYSTGSGSWNRSQYLFASAVPQPPIETTLDYISTTRNPSAQSQNVGVGIVFPFAGLAQQPVTGIIVGRSSDWAVDARVRAYVYGEMLTYQRLLTVQVAGSPDSAVSVFMRYD